MSIGSPKKFTLAKELAKAKEVEKSNQLEGSITRVHKNSGHKIKKELRFSNKKSKSKLA